MVARAVSHGLDLSGPSTVRNRLRSGHGGHTFYDEELARLLTFDPRGRGLFGVDGALVNDPTANKIYVADHFKSAAINAAWNLGTGADAQAVADARATGVFQPFEKEYVRKDGSRVPALVGGALFDREGVEGVAFVLDLSERKRAERALRRSEAFLAEGQHLSQPAPSRGAWRAARSPGRSSSIASTSSTWQNRRRSSCSAGVSTPRTPAGSSA